MFEWLKGPVVARVGLGPFVGGGPGPLLDPRRQPGDLISAKAMSPHFQEASATRRDR